MASSVDAAALVAHLLVGGLVAVAMKKLGGPAAASAAAGLVAVLAHEQFDAPVARAIRQAIA